MNRREKCPSRSVARTSKVAGAMIAYANKAALLCVDLTTNREMICDLRGIISWSHMSQEVERVFDDGSVVSCLGHLQIEEFWYEPA
jgi:hypothetical protein